MIFQSLDNQINACFSFDAFIAFIAIVKSPFVQFLNQIGKLSQETNSLCG
jgi:hypothetical protein